MTKPPLEVAHRKPRVRKMATPSAEVLPASGLMESPVHSDVPLGPSLPVWGPTSSYVANGDSASTSGRPGDFG
ncbi:MAG TPA: hypothetical protein VMS77_07680 [Conexivisphaerales archaeon]|nr:hypothetical protein [Conexivisphaerales archaeon]